MKNNRKIGIDKGRSISGRTCVMIGGKVNIVSLALTLAHNEP